jgi:hypothetical protein
VKSPGEKSRRKSPVKKFDGNNRAPDLAFFNTRTRCAPTRVLVANFALNDFDDDGMLDASAMCAQ